MDVLINMENIQKRKNPRYSVWSDKKIWECQNHPGCLISIPCDCKNCTRYTKFLELRTNASQRDKVDKISDYLDCHLCQH